MRGQGRKVAVEGFDAAMARQALMGGFASSRILECTASG